MGDHSDSYCQWRIQGGLSGHAPIRFGNRVCPLGEGKMIVKGENGVKMTQKGNQEENWAEKRFVKENLAPMCRGGKNAITVGDDKKGHQKFWKIELKKNYIYTKKFLMK